MLKCESLNKILNGDKAVSYTCFKNDLIDFIKGCMKEINKNTYHYLPRVNITNNPEVLGISIKLNEIEIDESVFKYIYSGKKIHLLDIFHELAHNRQKYLIINGTIDKNLSDIIKEDLLDYYFEINNKEKESFYKINYDLDSSEVQADLEGIDLFYSYITENNINLNLMDLYYLSDLTKDLRKK